MASIDLSDISKSFSGTAVLRKVSLSIADGEFITLVGPSGCGKSTLLRILAGLERADGGQVMIAGRDVTAIRPAHRNLAMVFQSYALYPHLSVGQNMATPLKLRDLGRAARLPVIGPLLARAAYAEIGAQVRQTADILQISHLLDRKPGQLSGGQRQRVALGRAMVRQPVAFLMDEPLSNLDAALRVHMRAELSELHRRLGATFVYVTHDQAEALTMSDKMAVMIDGAILQFGPPDQVFANPDRVEVAEFVGSPKINLLPGEIGPDGGLEVFDQKTAARFTEKAGPVRVGIRPEHMRLNVSGAAWSGRVTHRESLGSDLFFHIVLEHGETRVVVRGTQDEHAGLGIGDTAKVGFRPSRVLVFGADGTRLRGHMLAQQAEVA